MIHEKIKKPLIKKVFLITSLVILAACLIYLFTPKNLFSFIPADKRESIIGCFITMNIVTSMESEEITGDHLICLIDILMDKKVKIDGRYSAIVTEFPLYHIDFYSASAEYSIKIDSLGNVYSDGVKYKILDDGATDILELLSSYFKS